jgi:hypothetical protein
MERPLATSMSLRSYPESASSTKDNPSSDCNTCSDIQEISRIKSPLAYSQQSTTCPYSNPDQCSHSFPHYSSRIHLEWSPTFSDQQFVLLPHLSHCWCTARQFNHPNTIWWEPKQLRSYSVGLGNGRLVFDSRQE